VARSTRNSETRVLTRVKRLLARQAGSLENLVFWRVNMIRETLCAIGVALEVMFRRVDELRNRLQLTTGYRNRLFEFGKADGAFSRHGKESWRRAWWVELKLGTARRCM